MPDNVRGGKGNMKGVEDCWRRVAWMVGELSIGPPFGTNVVMDPKQTHKQTKL